MQRWELSALDGKHLALVSVPRPGPGPGEALVAVDAVSLNYRDNLIMANRLGAEPPLPLVPASDMAGVVVDLGADCWRQRLSGRRPADWKARNKLLGAGFLLEVANLGRDPARRLPPDPHRGRLLTLCPEAERNSRRRARVRSTVRIPVPIMRSRLMCSSACLRSSSVCGCLLVPQWSWGRTLFPACSQMDAMRSRCPISTTCSDLDPDPAHSPRLPNRPLTAFRHIRFRRDLTETSLAVPSGRVSEGRCCRLPSCLRCMTSMGILGR